MRVLPRQYGTFPEALATEYGPRLHSIGVPMTLTAKPPPIHKHLVSANTVEEPQLFDGLGTVETYVCCGCGFIEWYCQDPAAMPIGDEYNTQLVDYSSPAPYR
ncbi:MAG TPA: hypothetical protein VLX92_35220 [Kofleriaceae bacterium]|nr:hypothetical protein [Kofleriaceae bacterium]